MEKDIKTQRNGAPVEVEGQLPEGEELPISSALAVPTPASPLTLNESILRDGKRELDGMDEFSGSSVFWVSLNPQKGVLECKRLGQEWQELLCQIVDCRVIRVAKDQDGQVFCWSLDRVQATDRNPAFPGSTICQECPYRDKQCFHRWWIAFVSPEQPDLLFAHTLSQMGSMNFHIYVNKLVREGISPSACLTRIFIEEAKRKRQNTMYRRLAFEKVADL